VLITKGAILPKVCILKKNNQNSVMKIFKKVRYLYRKYITGYYYKLLLGKFGANSIIVKPSAIDGAENIFIGDDVIVSHGSWLASVPHTGEKNCRLTIGNGTYIGRYSHIYAVNEIKIGKKVLIADKVYISDNTHSYKDTSLPVIDQPVVHLKNVYVGDGSWLGENVCIIGASVGRKSIIAANSVVLKDVPDYCVAAGAPAIIIKRLNPETGNWQKTNQEGGFI
jgi:acetyltransferase-like isoleucine patch superfamily enzyme